MSQLLLAFKKRYHENILLGNIIEDAANAIRKKEADIDTSISKRTNYVIVGSGAGLSKLKKIQEFNEAG